VEVDMFQHVKTLNHAVNSIEHPYEEPNFVFMPDAFHDENPFKIYTSEFSMAKTLFLSSPSPWWCGLARGLV
jgi:hypothetical protein